MISSDFPFFDCPLQCGFTSGNGNKLEIIFHLKEECSKRFLIDADSIFCEDPHSVIIIHENTSQIESCSKCAGKNDFKSIIERDLSQTEEQLSENNEDKTLNINFTNLELEESIIDYKKVFSKEREAEDSVMEGDSYDRKTNFTSRQTSVNDTMIAYVYEPKTDRSKFKDSFYDVSSLRGKRLNSVPIQRNGLNDTMCEENTNKLAYSYNNFNNSSKNFKFSKGKNILAKSDDTMIMDTTKNISYYRKYTQNEIREENNEDNQEYFYLEGEFLDFEDIQEYFIN